MSDVATTENCDIVSFINMKGGVGKTTLCLSLAYQLSKEFEKKVLIIDMDPQFNATQTMMDQYNLTDEYLNNYRHNISVLKIFERNQSMVSDDSQKEYTADDVIVKSSENENLDIIVGTIDLINEDKNQDSTTSKRLDIFIRKNKLKEYYDYIFIDCPPTISFFTDAALLASNKYIIPVRVDKFSTLGVKLLDKVISKYKEDPDFKLDPVGIIYTIQEEQSKLAGIKEIFEDSSVVQDYPIFNNGVRKHNHLLSGGSGNIAYNYQELRPEMREICKEFIEKAK